MSYEKLKSLDNLDDVLIVRKIEKKIPSTSSDESIQATQCLCFQSGCDCERDVLVEEQEAIIKKQLQMLQADERGKQALINELAALKERQENRSELLGHRQRALEKEKERARKIAYLPPPLPKSVKSLLKKNDNEPKFNKPDVQMPDELTAITIRPIEIGCKNTENKENMTDPEELESRQKMQEEWDMKAKKRYNEALKKDRQKEEYTRIMKQIQNAELLNRREMAKNISADKGMPCPLSDKFQTARKQVDMEDATERIFKKTGTKEHVIEDIEGYQDHYEEKYKKIDSTCEAKMISCVPSFIKENYDYLLEDNSKFVGGKNFSGLDDSCSDILNQAYIETSPGADELHGTEEIHQFIRYFDKLRSVLETEIEENVKPLLAAAIEIPKKESRDQAVGTESIKVPAEDKAVETDLQFKNEPTSPSPTATFNFINSGVMAYKRRPRIPTLHTYEEMHWRDMHQRDVHYVIPSASESEGPAGSWSPSTYCSLPSKHGIPAFSNGSKSTVCDICIAEKKKDQLTDNFVQASTPTSVVFNEGKYRNLTASSEKTPLSEYVQPLAQKYLSTNSTKSIHQNENIAKSFGDSANLDTMTTSPAFEKEVIGKSKIGVFSEPGKSKNVISVPEKIILPEEEKKSWTSDLIIEKLIPVAQTETIVKTNEAENKMIKNEKLQDDIKLKIKDNELQESPNEYSEYDYEVKRIQAIHQVLSRKISSLVLNDSDKPEEKDNEKETKQFMFPAKNMDAKPHIYHELSTIQEVDSGLTASNLQLSQSKLSDTSETKGGKDVLPKEKLNDSRQSAERLKIVSLLDPPDTEIAELAKSIHFVPETEKKISHTIETSERSFPNSPTDKSTSKEQLSTPTLGTGSYSSVSISTPSLTLSSSSKSISSTKSRENNGSQNCIILGYIRDLDVPQTSAAAMCNPHQDIGEYNSLPSGYISDLEVPHISTDAHFRGEDNKDTALPGYIRDLDGFKKVASDKDFLLKQEQFLKQISPEKNFRPMTPHSNVSSSCESINNYLKKDLQNHSRAKNFKPVIPHSSVSKLIELIDHDLKKDPRDDSTGNFKPMTPHFNVSSPTELTPHNFENDQQNADFAVSLNSTPLYRNVSSPWELLNPAVKSDIQRSNSAGSFKALTPHSNVSSPSSNIFSLNDKYKGYVSSFGNFKALSPYSNVSSPANDTFLRFENMPIGDAHSSEKLEDKNAINKPIRIRLDIATDCVTLNTIENKPLEAKHVSQLNCNLTLKTLLNPTDSSLTTQVPRAEITSGAVEIKKFNDKSKNKVKKRHKGLHLSAAKQYALACSSDFFIPSITEDSTPLNENISKDLSKIATENNDDIHKPETLFGSQVSISDKKNEEKLIKIPEKKESDSESTVLDTKISKKLAEEKLFTMKSKDTLQAQVQVENVRNQCGNLQGLSSASSSSENLSVISRSKVVYQSTPIKNMSELLKEPGILEEPNLTLITTDLSCKMDTTVLTKGPLTSVSSEETLHQKKICSAGLSEAKCRTPISSSSQILSSPDTPSMISFLQHEMSCKQQAANNSALVQSPTDKNPVSQNFEENNTPVLREVKRSLFKRSGYKERTKRLWNNLEEVRKKNIAEERKKEIENNLKKAKEFAKKLTPKRRKN